MTATQALVIGIGSGHPGHLTAEAVAAMNSVDVFLVADKGEAKHDLVALRAELCRAVIDHNDYRFVEVPDPERGPDRGPRRAALPGRSVGLAHRAGRRVRRGHRPRTAGRGNAGFLVWGDPAFYDSTIRIVESVAASGVELALIVIPGISSLQLLAARHKIILNRIGTSIHVTTGRRLVAEFLPS